ncbi:MAG: TIGR03842 family LLM class F420-dependent oxidoreductase [Actinobacteria bacterium]|jgi:probable F420-dependent oxidoreductase|nr:TIGR03842 family LLM class F420-dependent oxidoreductase [Actinomycetota bacterium]NDC44590.1 TIGR03842 family LLM class F420-dependent oxidoreductase [Actinomycetota bacterium]NDF40936.1 TIGR03842 family LLM class F420-dependent oxidoreductase [Actinomycetota bacterium]
MDIGVVLQTTPPSARVVDLAKKADMYGFSHVWTFDSHILWQEPYVIYSQILAETRNVIVGPMVTNPATRDWTVTASTYATLNEMFGNRTVCGIGRGDSAVRVTNGKPTTLATLRESIHVIRELGCGRAVDYNGSSIRFPWASKSELEVWVAAYGPKALALTGEVGDGFILQLADLSIAEWTIGAVRDAAKAAGRDPKSVKICVAAPAYVGKDIAHMREQTRWFGGMVGNHVADIVERYGENSNVPKALTDYIKGRQGYDYNEHGRAGNSHTTFVPDEIVDRFCILGDTNEHIRRLTELKELGVDQFAIYLQHDGKEETLEAYGEKILPAIQELGKAKQ